MRKSWLEFINRTAQEKRGGDSRGLGQKGRDKGRERKGQWPSISFRKTSSGIQKLVLTLCLGNISGRIQGTICSTRENQT